MRSSDNNVALLSSLKIEAVAESVAGTEAPPHYIY
jgi:hypothetical protein